jgi:hypothetical protein
MTRLIVTLYTLALLAFWPLAASAESPDDCTASTDDVTCPAERFKLLRDKARVGQLLCEALEVDTLDVALPADLQAVCESASLTSRIWAQAQTWREQDAAADEAQREANRKAGQIDELRGRVRELEGIRQRVGRVESQRNTWRVIAVSAGGLSVLSTVALIGDMAAWWDL